MPTVILLDVSLSMTRRVQLENDSEMQMIQLARHGVSHFFTALSTKCKLEFSSLVAFSSRWEIVVPFTRDYQALKEGLLAVDIYDKTCIETALQGVETLVMEELGATVPIHLVLVVDSCIGVGTGSLKESLTNRGEAKFPLPFPFPCYISIVCLGKTGELTSCQRWFHRLVELNQGKGEIITPEMPLSEARVQQCFSRVIQSHYDQYMGTLTCGNLKSHITLSPYPDFRSTLSDVLNRYRERRDDVSYLQMPEVIPIVGFLDIADVSSPSYISRYLVLTIAKPKPRKSGSAKRMKQEGSSSSAEEEGKVPSFCVLLHGSLKIEKMVAIAQLGDNWYGMLYSWSDNKKKSSLMLAVFEPRQEISWLGNFKSLGPSAELPLNPYQYDHKEDAEDTPFPIPPTKRKSYHIQPSLVWVRNTGLQADIQKVLSHAKKLPEKQTSFFKEVNRIRRAAVCYNFTDLLQYVADAIEREAKSHPHEVARQLNHAAESLRQAFKRDIVQNIVPLDKSILRV